MGRSVRAALDEARKVGVMKRTRTADELWSAWYVDVSDDVPGLWGAATARAEPYVLRLSMVYALMDGTAQIDQRHVEAAIAVWDYCSESARIIFGDRTGHADVDKLIDALEAVGRQGLNRTEQTRLFKNAKRKAGQARETAMQLGLVAEIEQRTATRPQQVLYLNQHAPEIGGD
jgi:DNA replicative helicase MCM subunit Mcm2 (Cdc46/Mcm family)